MSEYRNYDDDFIIGSDNYAKHVSAMTGEQLHSKADIAAELAYRDDRIEQLEAQLKSNSTPAAKWRGNGDRDPFGDTFNGERAELCCGNLTDDEMANAVYLNPDIGNLTGAKERIRWLSRRLVDACKERNELAARVKRLKKRPSTVDISLDNLIRIVNLVSRYDGRAETDILEFEIVPVPLTRFVPGGQGAEIAKNLKFYRGFARRHFNHGWVFTFGIQEQD